MENVWGFHEPQAQMPPVLCIEPNHFVYPICGAKDVYKNQRQRTEDGSAEDFC